MKKGSASAAGRCGKWLLPALAALTAAGWLGNSAIVTKEYTIASRRLPEAFSGMRIVQISDLHGKRFGKDDARLLRAVRQARPDLIALTGDFADELTELSALEPLLEGLTALAPVFYVTGNHEWVMDGAQRRELFALLDGCGVVRLRNSWRVLKSGGCRIVLAGVDDPNGPADQKTPEAWTPFWPDMRTAGSSACRGSGRSSARIMSSSRSLRAGFIRRTERSCSSAGASARAIACRCGSEIRRSFPCSFCGRKGRKRKHFINNRRASLFFRLLRL